MYTQQQKSNFIKSQTTEDRKTENDMVTHSTTDSAVLDLFSKIGAMRNQDEVTINSMVHEALNEDKLLATKVLFWARDIRGGAGERKVFRIAMRWMAKNQPDIFKINLHLIPVYGRWDDILAALNVSEEIDHSIVELIINGLTNKDTQGLVAKWMPREKSAKKKIAKKLMKLLELSPKTYRKMLSETSNTVEDLMCAKKWNDIEYDKVPSYAMNKYNKAFSEHSKKKFEKYLEEVKKGQKTIKSTTLYPYDLVRKIKAHNSQDNEDTINLQWKALPNYMEGIKGRRIMPIIDTSGSMLWGEGILPLYISISLGLYIAERNKGPFKDYLYIFSHQPEFLHIHGKNLSDKVKTLPEINFLNTDLEAVFESLLNKALNFNVLDDEMPTHLLIISDMEFDRAVINKDDTALKMVKKKYKNAGYKLPKIIFWNVESRNLDNSPVKMKEDGTALVSGASPAIMKSILTGEVFTPYDIMLNTINSERYEQVKV